MVRREELLAYRNINRMSCKGGTLLPRYPKITPPLTPMPRKVRWHKPDVQLPSPFILWLDKKDLIFFNEILQEFVQQVEEQLGISVEISCAAKPPTGFHLSLEAEATRFRHDQGYRLEISEQSMRIEAKSTVGVALGIQTLLQILLFSGRTVPTCYITDYPDLDLRGVYVNLFNGGVPRQETFQEMIRFLSALKLNRLDIFLADEAARATFHDWQKFNLQQYGNNRGVDIVWHHHEVLQKSHDEIFFLPLTEEKMFTGFGPVSNDQFQKWMQLYQNQTEKGISYGLNPQNGLTPTLIFLLFPLVTFAAKAWCLESNCEEEGHAWLDEIYFHERSGSAAASCRDLAMAVFNPNDRLQREQWLEIVLREQAQLEYLEFQRPGGKWLLNELQLTCGLLLRFLRNESDNRTLIQDYQHYRDRRYLPKTDRSI